MRDRHKLGRTCPCGASITDANTTGRCKPCFMRASNRDPAINKRRAAAMRQLCGPMGALRKQRLAALAKARAARDFEASKARGIHAAAMREFNNRKLKWLPDAWRPTYKKMLASGAYRAPEAKRIILAQIETEKMRAIQAVGDKAHCRDVINAAIGSQRLLEALKGAGL